MIKHSVGGYFFFLIEVLIASCSNWSGVSEDLTVISYLPFFFGFVSFAMLLIYANIQTYPPAIGLLPLQALEIVPLFIPVNLVASLMLL